MEIKTPTEVYDLIHAHRENMVQFLNSLNDPELVKEYNIEAVDDLRQRIQHEIKQCNIIMKHCAAWLQVQRGCIPKFIYELMYKG